MPIVASVLPTAGQPGVWVQLRGLHLDGVEGVWIRESGGNRSTDLPMRPLSPRVLLIRIPDKTVGGRIVVKVGGRGRMTPARFFVAAREDQRLPQGARRMAEGLNVLEASLYLRPVLPRIRKCRARGHRPRRVWVRVSVDGWTGAVASAGLQSPDPAVSSTCLGQAIRGVVFPVFRQKSQTLVLPIRF